jgi:hypothetical protein
MVAQILRDRIAGVFEMDHAQPDKMTLRVAPDVRRQLEEWASHNVSTMTAEINASVRFRAQREKAEVRQ